MSRFVLATICVASMLGCYGAPIEGADMVRANSVAQTCAENQGRVTIEKSPIDSRIRIHCVIDTK